MSETLYVKCKECGKFVVDDYPYRIDHVCKTEDVERHIDAMLRQLRSREEKND